MGGGSKVLREDVCVLSVSARLHFYEGGRSCQKCALALELFTPKCCTFPVCLNGSIHSCRNWCPHTVTKTVTCQVQNGTVLQRVYQTCRWPQGCSGGRWGGEGTPQPSHCWTTDMWRNWRELAQLKQRLWMYHISNFLFVRFTFFHAFVHLLWFERGDVQTSPPQTSPVYVCLWKRVQGEKIWNWSYKSISHYTFNSLSTRFTCFKTR